MTRPQHEKKAVLRRIAETELEIARQRAKIAQLKAEGQPTDVAEESLYALTNALHARKTDLDALTRSAKERKPTDRT